MRRTMEVLTSWVAAWLIVSGTLGTLYAIQGDPWINGAAYGWLGWLALAAHGLVGIVWQSWGKREILTPDDALLEWPSLIRSTDPGLPIQALMDDQYIDDVLNDNGPVDSFTKPPNRHRATD